ncbi:MAG: outer membrane beta-barrel protein [Candidatus Omnitrophota bacterium]|jgi:opacity protein-like surface antigen
MRILYIVGFLAVCVVTVFLCTSPAFALDKIKIYVEGEAGGSFTDFESRGWNTQGPHANTGEKSDKSAVAGMRLGAQLLDFLRADIGYTYRGCLGFTTNSYQPPTPTFFYRTHINNTNTVMFSLFLEPVHFKKFTPYIGAGVGSTWMKGYTNDTLVGGSSSQTNFSWQGETGIQYGLTDRISLKLGYRYVDMGNLKINLYHLGTGASAGDYKGKLTANEVIFGVRYNF